ncbi:TetR/AcrR family transcriptional regulator [Agromyces mediolanus]|uniref:TetR/AcrR family transcriptional regulator n=1 Tax=Agromyces mediolanus TaxID=41986 RepID=UPI0038353B0B
MTTATGARGGPSARGKARLDHDTIVAAGLELAAETGGITLSVRELGARLGADPTAIYRHFRNKEELMQALLDALNARSVATVTAPREDWRARLRQLSGATLELFSAHPAIAAEAVVLTTHGRGELDAVELMLDAFAQAGLADEELVRHYALLASHVLSTASGIARSRSERGANADGTSPWFDGPVLADPRSHPRVAEFGPRLVELEDRDLFQHGVEVIIASAERAAAGR